MTSLALIDPAPQVALPGNLRGRGVRGLYVHVPFCLHKCHYCDFYSIVRQTPERMSRFVDLVLTEADRWAGVAPAFDTAFFGGGTPTLLPAAELCRLIVGLRERFDLSNLHEFTIEANPATVDLAYCQQLAEVGVDRLSFGAQSFDTAALKMLERHHDPADIAAGLEAARAAGIGRLSIDLIFGIPGQTPDGWAETLDAGLALGTEHLSCYGLTYEPNTPLAVRKRLGRVTPVAEDDELVMLRHTRQRLAAAGMPAYEISNYAAPGKASLHNLVYWRAEGYLGLGPSAASHADGTRWKNHAHLGRWERAIEAGAPAAAEAEELSSDQRAEERLMLGLRLAEGVIVSDLEIIERAASVPHLVEMDENHLTLTNAGVEVADTVALHLLDP